MDALRLPVLLTILMAAATVLPYIPLSKFSLEEVNPSDFLEDSVTNSGF